MTNISLSNKTYDALKKLTQVGLPALGSLYFGLSTIWHLPNGEEVVGSLALLTTFFGVVLGISTNTYNKSDAGTDGKVVIQTDNAGKKIFGLELDGNPLDLQHQQRITFKVVDENEQFWTEERPPAE